MGHTEPAKEHIEHVKKSSRTVWLLVGIVVVLVVLGGIYYWLTFSPTRTAFLNVEGGVVEVDQGRGWQPAVDNMDLKGSDKVRTLEGKATIVLYESVLVSLDPNTEVSIDSLLKDKASIKQEKGSTWNKVTGLSGLQSYEVKTPNTVATVRGTAFEVNMDDEGDNVLVGEGSVGVDSDGSQETILAFEKVLSKKGLKLEKKQWSKEDKARIKSKVLRNIQGLKHLRLAELQKKQALVNRLKAKYKVSDGDIDKFFEDVDAGNKDDAAILKQVPVKSQSLDKIKGFDDQIKKELRFLKSLGD